jgi:hypothetical protein
MTEFERLYSGRLYGVMSWQQLADFWRRIDAAAGWFLYAVGEEVPQAAASADETSEFMRRIDALLRKEHREDYCGIVYADDLAQPRMVKIYDPNHLGSSCGSSKHPPLPGWIMSRMPPLDLAPGAHLPAGRRRWWQSLFGGAADNTRCEPVKKS